MNRSVLSLPSHYPPLSVLWIYTTPQHALTRGRWCQRERRCSLFYFLSLFVKFCSAACEVVFLDRSGVIEIEVSVTKSEIRELKSGPLCFCGSLQRVWHTSSQTRASTCNPFLRKWSFSCLCDCCHFNAKLQRSIFPAWGCDSSSLGLFTVTHLSTDWEVLLSKLILSGGCVFAEARVRVHVCVGKWDCCFTRMWVFICVPVSYMPAFVHVCLCAD